LFFLAKDNNSFTPLSDLTKLFDCFYSYTTNRKIAPHPLNDVNESSGKILIIKKVSYHWFL
jgi:hypothetical protein